MNIPNLLGKIFAIEQLQWLLLNYVLVSERIFKKKDSGDIAVDLINLLHIQMRAFAFAAKFYYHKISETISRRRPKRLHWMNVAPVASL